MGGGSRGRGVWGALRGADSRPDGLDVHRHWFLQAMPDAWGSRHASTVPLYRQDRLRSLQERDGSLRCVSVHRCAWGRCYPALLWWEPKCCVMAPLCCDWECCGYA